MYLMFDEVAIELHELAVEKGYWDVIKNANQEQIDIFMTRQLMLIVSEATEVMEAIRKDKGPEAIADEVADILIRTFDLYAGLVEEGYTSVSLDYAFENKTSMNRLRAHKQGAGF
jgi:NTP pyrophosphatase (non-canonical NTP hydrolase)